MQGVCLLGKLCNICAGFGKLWIMVSDVKEKDYGYYRFVKCGNCSGRGTYNGIDGN
jgi:hypothetical protein